ncbi:hypothetical protein VIGAN_05251200 [Vigna angularis var. angularis]|uniref:Uncharacterized protein n=1 Tax=Vigna angularis var. angularis TaxID=157739 RepID=A0A0S3S7P4_PHAAN|nr:hypothetical protein VIGAN_05251200 [Vigna angularis var. angularis]
MLQLQQQRQKGPWAQVLNQKHLHHLCLLCLTLTNLYCNFNSTIIYMISDFSQVFVAEREKERYNMVQDCHLVDAY